ncbi:MAG: type II secretion system F family protein [Candidatus Omnitrophica bacterium]|nr:type II secretion system F family protein [Candidatus Omnitrophota bacterium]MBU0879112.1 type II secretion system F family protein [Candidatus Omnitrophota bacterium]MBU1133503.1 type II secretion system F family protein [Candidatus Omnitrophota bacterium]MBU1366296.1 type II secretion system F family protein [Candidatus Omnitrophota bacterium]MBU1523132.1 type II secretion system F family protein [Candidatus Omnitrophota bacterium]
MGVILVLVFIFIIAAVIFFSFYFTPLTEKKVDTWQKKKTESLENELKDMFLEGGVSSIVKLHFILPPLLAFSGYFLLHHYLGAILGAAIGFVVPSFIANLKKGKTRSQFDNQIVNTINCVASSLKGGLSIFQALGVVVEDMPSPTKEQFAWIVKENKMGITLEDSLARLNDRMKLENLQLVINAVLVAKETGGNLPKILARVVTAIRDNRKLKTRMRVLTLQGKMQGIIMSILPIAFIFFVKSTNPHHFDIMFQTELGKMLLAAALILQIVGMFFIIKLSKI